MAYYRIIAAAFVLYVLFKCYRRYRQKHISTRRMLLWTVFWSGVLAVSWVPQVTDRISQQLGVEKGVHLAFFVAILLILYLLAMMYAHLEQTRQEITELVRLIALRDLKSTGCYDDESEN